MRTILIMILIAISFNVRSQVTFERTYSFNNGFKMEELSDHSFVGCGDSAQTGLIFKLDRFGNLVSTFKPSLRNRNVSINDITFNPLTGGYALCGYADDTTSNDSTAFYLLVDSLMQNTDSLFYSGGVSGPTARIILRNRNNDFIVGVEEFHGSGSYFSGANKIRQPATNIWTSGFASNLSPNAMALDSTDKLLFAGFRWVTASWASLQVFDTSGISLHNFSITDTAYGGSMIFISTTAPTADGNYIFAANVSPNGGSNSVAYLAKLDTAFNIKWAKYLDWGISVGIVGVTSTYDSCIVLLLSTGTGLAIHKLNSSGDSLWTQFHSRPTTGSGSRFQECKDRGFIVVGTFYDSISHSYVLKTDSLGRLLPDVTLTTTGTLEFCQGDSVLFSAQPGYDYLWSTNEITQSIKVNITGSYFVTVTDSSGLQAISDTIHVLVHATTQPVISLIFDTLESTTASSYQWYLGGQEIIGAINQTYTPLVNGSYEVETIDSNGCSSISNIYLVTTVGFAEVTNISLKATLYPNPTSNQTLLTLQPSVSGKIQVALINTIGQLESIVFEDELEMNKSIQIPIDTELLYPGVYTIKIMNGDRAVFLRLLVLK